MYAIVMTANGKRKLLKHRFQLQNLAKRCRDSLTKWCPDCRFEVTWVPPSMPPSHKKGTLPGARREG